MGNTIRRGAGTVPPRREPRPTARLTKDAIENLIAHRPESDLEAELEVVQESELRVNANGSQPRLAHTLPRGTPNGMIPESRDELPTTQMQPLRLPLPPEPEPPEHPILLLNPIRRDSSSWIETSPGEAGDAGEARQTSTILGMPPLERAPAALPIAPRPRRRWEASRVEAFIGVLVITSVFAILVWALAR